MVDHNGSHIFYEYLSLVEPRSLPHGEWVLALINAKAHT